MAQARPSLSNLPLEIFSDIIWMLRREDDLVDVWTKTRNVSRGFRHAVDSMVQRHHLPKTVITFDIGDSGDKETGTLSGAILMSFQHLSDRDPTRAIFSQEEMRKGFVEWSRIGFSRLFKEPNDWCCPKQIVLIRRIINDTEIPEFEWHPENLTISCNWRDLFTALLLEQRLYNTKIAAWWEETGQASAKKFHAQMAAGKTNKNTVLVAVGHEVVISEEKAYRDARRQRIARHYVRDTGQPFSGLPWGEERAMKSLSEARFRASYAEYSDDEKEEGEESGSEATSEEAHARDLASRPAWGSAVQFLNSL